MQLVGLREDLFDDGGSCMRVAIFEFQRPFQTNHRRSLSLSRAAWRCVIILFFIFSPLSTFSLKMYFIHLYAPCNRTAYTDTCMRTHPSECVLYGKSSVFFLLLLQCYLSSRSFYHSVFDASIYGVDAVWKSERS